MKKFLILLLINGLAPIIGGLYGILNDQLTYTISPEYYTKFKFYQFGLVDFVNGTNPRIGVSVVGFSATWWVGLPIGVILGLVGLIHKNSKQMFYASLRAIFVTVIVAFITGLIGLAYGKFYLANTGVNWWLPDNLIDTKNFITVGSMHNFSYLGGLTGLIAGIIYSIRQKRKYETTETDNKTPAGNMRFGATAAVAPQKRQCIFGSLYPAGSLVEAATTPSRWDVRRQRGDSAAGKEMKYRYISVI